MDIFFSITGSKLNITQVNMFSLVNPVGYFQQKSQQEIHVKKD